MAERNGKAERNGDKARNGMAERNGDKTRNGKAERNGDKTRNGMAERNGDKTRNWDKINDNIRHVILFDITKHAQLHHIKHVSCEGKLDTKVRCRENTLVNVGTFTSQNVSCT